MPDNPRAAESTHHSHAPLAGIRVVDLTRYLPGPFCALQLAWLGADVTVLEQPPIGDPMRAMPPIGPDGVSLAFTSLRRGCTSEFVDLSDAAGLERALELIAGADVVLEGFRPGVAERLGVGPQLVRERWPSVVYCSLTGYGQTGPWAQAPGHDNNYEAVAGLLAQSGTPERMLLPPVPLADLAGGWAAATAVCAALVSRATTNVGSHIDISLTEAAMQLQAMGMPSAGTGELGRGAGMLTGAFAAYDTYACAEGTWLAVGPIEPKFFATLCALIGVPELAGMQFDPEEQDAIRTELRRALSTRTAHEWDDLLAGADGGASCACRVLDPIEVAHHPQMAARGAVTLLGGDETTPAPASPYVFDGVRTGQVREADGAVAVSGSGSGSGHS